MEKLCELITSDPLENWEIFNEMKIKNGQISKIPDAIYNIENNVGSTELFHYKMGRAGGWPWRGKPRPNVYYYCGMIDSGIIPPDDVLMKYAYTSHVFSRFGSAGTKYRLQNARDRMYTERITKKKKKWIKWLYGEEHIEYIFPHVKVYDYKCDLGFFSIDLWKYCEHHKLYNEPVPKKYENYVQIAETGHDISNYINSVKLEDCAKLEEICPGITKKKEKWEANRRWYNAPYFLRTGRISELEHIHIHYGNALDYVDHNEYICEVLSTGTVALLEYMDAAKVMEHNVPRCKNIHDFSKKYLGI